MTDAEEVSEAETEEVSEPLKAKMFRDWTDAHGWRKETFTDYVQRILAGGPEPESGSLRPYDDRPAEVNPPRQLRRVRDPKFEGRKDLE